MSRSYWIIEYLKVAAAYGFTMYVWPIVVFREHLKKKSIAYRFVFCTLSMTIIPTAVISIIGIFKLLYTPLLAALFYGIFVVKLLRHRNPFPKIWHMLGCFHRKTLTPKRILLNASHSLREGIRQLASMIRDGSEGHRLEYSLLIIGLVYATVYFSYTAVAIPSPLTSDQYVHHAWAYALGNNKIYSGGVYPIGMHCIMYILSYFFGISLYSVNLFLAVVHIHAILLGAFLMMKELYSFRYTPLFGLYAFATVGVPSSAGISAMARLTMTLPQEYGFVAVFLCGYSLLRYMKRPKVPNAGMPRRKFGFLRSIIEDDDLRFFILAISYTIMVHYYATIMAFFICIVIFISYLPWNLQWNRLFKIAAATLIALLLAAAPTGAALAKGYKFHGSIDWALSVSKGGEKKSEDAASAADGDDGSGQGSLAANGDEGSGQGGLSSRKSLLTRAIDAAIAAPELLKKTSEKHEARTFQVLYSGKRGKLLRIACIAGIGASFAVIIVFSLVRKLSGLLGAGNAEDSALNGSFFAGKGFLAGRLTLGSFVAYFSIASMLLVYVTGYSPAAIGLPILIAGDRLCAITELLAVMTYCCLPDLLLSIIDGHVPEALLSFVGAAACLGIYGGMALSGSYHGFLFNYLSRYPAAVEMTERIIHSMPKNKFTIVSTTEELYHGIDYGYHEEMIDFVLNTSNRTYTIPTPYIFVYLEKKPLHYGQLLFPQGPKWLASDYYAKKFGHYYKNASVYPDLLHGETSATLAAQELPDVRLRSDYGMHLGKREIMESKAMEWYEAFRKAYPNDGTVVYEDDYFLCYCIKQNEFSLFTLGILD